MAPRQWLRSRAGLSALKLVPRGRYARTMNNRFRLRASVLALAVLLGACTVPLEEPPPPARPVSRPAPPAVESPPVGEVPQAPVPEPAPPPPPAPIPPPPPASSGATAALLQQGRQQAASGNYPMATSSFERALRINPRDAEVWLELGWVKLKQGDRAQAENMGRRALSLAGSDAARRARCEELIAAARSGR